MWACVATEPTCANAWLPVVWWTFSKKHAAHPGRMVAHLHQPLAACLPLQLATHFEDTHCTQRRATHENTVATGNYEK